MNDRLLLVCTHWCGPACCAVQSIMSNVLLVFVVVQCLGMGRQPRLCIRLHSWYMAGVGSGMGQGKPVDQAVSSAR